MSETQSIEDRLKEQADAMNTYKERLDFGSFKDGDNDLVIDVNQPVEKIKGKYGIQQVYTATLNGERVKIGLSKSVEIPILKGLQKKKVSFSVTRKGKGIDTSYKVKVN